MASSFSLKSHSYGGRYIELTCTQSKDIESNVSPISWKLSAKGGEVNYYASSVQLSINETSVYDSGYTSWDKKIFPAAKGEKTGTTTVSHEENGKKKINVSMTVMIYDGVYRTVSDEWELDDIAIGAFITKFPPSFSSNEDPPTIEYSNPAGNNVTKIEMCIADKNAYYGYADYREVDKAKTEYTFTSEDMENLKALTTNSLEVTFVIRTKIGDVTLASAKPSTFTMVEDDTTKPTVSMEVTLDNSSLPSKFAEMWIQGKSRADVEIAAQTKYYATVQGYTVEIGSDTYNGGHFARSTNFKSNVINGSGNVKITADVKDTRGFTGKDSKEITVIEYSKPLVVPYGNSNSILCHRSNESGEKKRDGTSLWIKANMSYHTVGNLNRCALQWRRKLSTVAWSNQEWTDLISNTATDVKGYNALLQGIVFDKEKSYTVQIRAIDDLGEYDIKEFDIPTQDVALHLGRGGKNVSIGTYCDYSIPYTFYSDWDAYFDKDVYIGGVELDYPIEQGTSGIWTYRKWASGIAECWGLYPITKAEITTPWGSLFETPIDYSVDFPSGLFVAAPAVQFSAPTAAGGVLGLETMGETTKTKTCKLYPIRATLPESTIDLTVAIQAKGLWK